MSRENARQIRKLIADLEAQGWVASIRRNTHIRLTPPGGGEAYYCPSTPGDRRTILNVRSQLRRRGAKV